MAAKPTFDSIIEEYKPRCIEALKKFLPKQFDDTSIADFFGPPQYTYDNLSASESLLTPMWDLLNRGGKTWRPILLCLVTEALGGDLELVTPISVLAEVVHNGTLMIDDIEDDSKMRRGKPCIHIDYGNDIAINTGNAMYFFPLKIFREYKQKKLVSDPVLIRCYELYAQELTNVHIGQGLDIYWHKGKGNPTAQDYLQMCLDKTGVLARLSARLAALLSGASDDVIHHVGVFAATIGVAFQIQDDLLNIDPSPQFAAKISVIGEDIHEGKRSLMAIHSMSTGPKDKAARLSEILNSQTSDPVIINEAIDIMRSTNSLEFARGEAVRIIKDAWNNIAALLPDGPGKEKLRIFADYLIQRDN